MFFYLLVLFFKREVQGSGWRPSIAWSLGRHQLPCGRQVRKGRLGAANRRTALLLLRTSFKSGRSAW